MTCESLRLQSMFSPTLKRSDSRDSSGLRSEIWALGLARTRSVSVFQLAKVAYVRMNGTE